MITEQQSYSERYKLVYATLFSLGIASFLTNVYNYWSFVSGPEFVVLDCKTMIIGLIHLYFFINYFRYLFGLLTFAEMTKNLVPVKKDWPKNIFRNMAKLMVMNVGIFQLIIFFGLSLKIAPSMPNIFKGTYEATRLMAYLTGNLSSIYKMFFWLNIALLASDLIAVWSYNKLAERKSDVDQKRVYSWGIAQGAELLFCVLGLLAPYNGNSSDFVMPMIFICIIFLSLLMEMFGGYYIFANQPSNKTSEDATA
jgi:hypothetical protein